MKQWYEELFENYAEKYDSEIFTQGTLQEVDFIESEINSNKQVKILDIGCGTGRHSIELTRRGYSVVGYDLSENQLKRAKEKAEALNLNIEFLQADARKFCRESEFDLAIMLCEGAFPLMETDEMNFDILANASRSIKPGGKFIFTTLSVLFPLFHSVRDFANQSDNVNKYEGITFDFLTFRDHSKYEVTDDSGEVMNLNCNQRYYAPSEIMWMLKSLGFSKVEIFSTMPGGFSRDRKINTEDFEMLVVAEK